MYIHTYVHTYLHIVTHTHILHTTIYIRTRPRLREELFAHHTPIIQSQPIATKYPTLPSSTSKVDTRLNQTLAYTYYKKNGITNTYVRNY